MTLKPLTPLEKRRNGHLLRTYGIDLGQYNQLLRKQRNRCFCCQRLHTEFPRALAVDHDHKTGEIRGLLCTHCNRRVIGRHRDHQLLTRAGRYLKGPHTGWFVPAKKKKKRKTK